MYDATPSSLGEYESAAAVGEYQINTEGYRSVYDEAPITMGTSSSAVTGEYQLNTEGYRSIYDEATNSQRDSGSIISGDYQLNTEGYTVAEYEVSGFQNPPVQEPS